MDVQIKMPDLATATDTVRIVSWLIEVGRTVQLGQPLLEIETDKATMDVEAVAGGTLKEILFNAGDEVAIGQVIAIIGAVEAPQSVGQSPSPMDVVRAAPAAETLPAKQSAKVSLFARNRAARQARETAEIVLNGTQREVARRLQESKQQIPHYYLTASANAERLIAARSVVRERAPSQNVVWDALFVAAVAKAIRDFDRMRYQFVGDRLVRRATEAIGVAADIGGELYVVPVDNALTSPLEQISEQITDRVERIRRGDSSAKKLAETCITITNLGSENIETFAAVINPPEAAILAIGKIAPTVQPMGDQLVIQQRVTLTLSVDHRIANGKYAAGFLSRIVKEIETM
jgi:pyruvate dehydrogenase E2 component (dihydrolipoamide acetyltransferase)